MTHDPHADTKPDAEPGDEALAEAADDALGAADDFAAALGAEVEALRSKLAYALADAGNARIRAEKEVADARVYAVQRFATDLLSVADNIGRALALVTPDQRESLPTAVQNVLSGVEMTEKELLSAFARHNLHPIAPGPGDKFDPNLHQAAVQIPAATPAGTVAQPIQTGWRLAERTLRAAIVAVSAGPAASETPVGATVDTKV